MDINEVIEALGTEWRLPDGPLYRKLAAAFKEAIGRGDLGPPARIPSERDLARRLRVSRTTVASAYALLRDEGLVESSQGSGTRVAARGGAFVPGVITPSLRFVRDAGGEVIDCAAASVAEVNHVPNDRLVVSADEVRTLVARYVYEPSGIQELRQAIADRYTLHGLPTSADDVLVTTGAQQAVALLFSLFGRDQGTVLVENPTYVGALDAARSVATSVVGVSSNAGVMDLEDLRDKLRRFPARAIYVMTTCQNPTGGIMSETRRAELMELAAETETPIIDDMTLSDLVFDGKDRSFLASMGRATVVTIGSLSKLYWPGLRIGWIRAPAPLLARVARLKVVGDLGSSHFSQILAARLVAAADSFATIRRAQLKERFELFADLLKRDLPDWRFTPPGGGPFLWVLLPHGQADAFASLALRHGVQVLSGAKMSPDDSKNDCLRVSYVSRPDDLRTAVDRLRRTWDAFERGVEDSLSLDVVV